MKFTSFSWSCKPNKTGDTGLQNRWYRFQAPVRSKPVAPDFQNRWYRFRPAAHRLAPSARNGRRKGSGRSRGMPWCLPRAQFARRRPEKGDRRVRRIFKRPRRWGSNFGRGTAQMSSGMGGGRGEAGVGGRNRRPAVGCGRSGGDGGSAH